MSRTPVAVLAGSAFLLCYLFTVLALSDWVIRLHWAVQALFFAVAGVAWAWPVARLMRWGAGGR